MNGNDILVRAGVDAMMIACAGLKAELTWYVFGSVLIDELSPGDIDILCVAPDASVLGGVQKACEEHLLKAPIHLRLLTSDQEHELNFICRTNARQYSI